MKPMGDARQHYWRTLKMAKALGVPLATALDDGRLTQADYAKMIEKCRRCPHPGQCEALLAKGECLDEAPDFCCNREILMALREG